MRRKKDDEAMPLIARQNEVAGRTVGKGVGKEVGKGGGRVGGASLGARRPDNKLSQT